MSKIIDRLPISLVNTVLAGGVLLGGVVAAILGNWLGALCLGATALGVVGFALNARRPTASDRVRIANFEYQGNRDRVIGRHAFAVVGAVAMFLAAVECVVMVVADSFDWWTLLRFFVLSWAWSFAIRDSLKGDSPASKEAAETAGR